MSGSAGSGIRVWIHPRTRPRIPDPGLGGAVVRWAQGLVACLGPDPAPSPWGFVSGVGAQTGRKVGGGQERWIRKVGWVQKSRDRRRKNENGATAAAGAGWRQRGGVRGGRWRRVAGERESWLGGLACAASAQSVGACSAAVSDTASAATASPPRKTGASIMCTCHGSPLSHCIHERSAAGKDACRRRAVAALGRRRLVGRSLKSRSGCGLACQPGIGSNQGSGT